MTNDVSVELYSEIHKLVNLARQLRNRISLDEEISKTFKNVELTIKQMGAIESDENSAKRPSEILSSSQSSDGLTSTPQNGPNTQQTT